MGITTNDGEDAGHEEGWTIGNAYLREIFGRGWVADTSGRSFRIAIKGSAATATQDTQPLLSADATLSGLTLADGGGKAVALNETFAWDEKTYTADVASSVALVTVTPTTNHASSTVAYLDASDAALADADTNAAGHQVALAVGANVFKVKVTAEDTTTTKTYTVTVTRRAADALGEEGEWRLTEMVDYPNEPDPDMDPNTTDGRFNVTAGRAEVSHAGRWGTVCSDGIRDKKFNVFDYDSSNALVMVTDAEGNEVPSETEYDNEAAALICKDRGYDDGEYHGKYSKHRPGEAEADHQVADYWPASRPYTSAATPIWIDDLRCVAGELALTGTGALPGAMSHCGYAGWGLHNCTHKEDAVVRCWNNDPAGVPGHAVGPLTAAFAELPSRHEGTAFTFRIEFSEDVAVSAADMRDHALTVTGGTVTGAAQVDGRVDLWSITVTPSGTDEVPISLPPGRDCSETGAVCTADGRQLSTGLAQIVAGPPVVLLTASFEAMPEAHDGESAFRFRVAFSENIGISYRSLREDAFAVAGGRVTRGKRVDDRRDLFEMTVEPDGDGEVTVTLPAGRECSVSGAICTKGENRRQLTNAPTATVAGPAVETGPAPLTASFVDMPDEHDGESAFTFRIAFSERVGWMNGRRLRENVVAVAGGRATSASRVNRRRDLWQVTVEPDSLADVTVALSAGAACRTPAAVCTSDGRALSNSISATVRGPVTVSVADARAEEGADETIDFAVTLSRAGSDTITVDYATADGTATAGADYTRAGGTLSFAPGETAKTVAVPVLDDAHDEGEETFTLRLTAATGARIADGVATGTIENTDHMPAAWLARFGRTVTDQVLDAVEERLAAPRAAGRAGDACRPGAALLGRQRQGGREHRIGVRGGRFGACAGGAGPRRDDGDPRLDGACRDGPPRRRGKRPVGRGSGGPRAVAGADRSRLPDRDVVRADRRLGRGGRVCGAVGPGRDLALRRARGRPFARRRGDHRADGRGLGVGARGTALDGGAGGGPRAGHGQLPRGRRLRRQQRRHRR